MSDELDSLTDAQITNTFRQEVAGMYFGASYKRSDPEFTWRMLDTENHVTFPPDFTTDADAIFEYLEGHSCVEIQRVHQRRENGLVDDALPLHWRFQIFLRISKDHIPEYAEATAPEFARASCIALIRAKRSEKGTK